MGWLVGAPIACADPAVASPTTGVAAVDRFAPFMAEAAQRFGISAAWIRAVMRVESGGAVHALSPKGAMGLMQLRPLTWAVLRIRYGLGADPFDAHDNIMAGAAYLRELYDRYGAPGFLAAYNAGPARYDDYLTTGRPLPAETRPYVAALAPAIVGRGADGTPFGQATLRSWTDAPLFTGRPAIGPAVVDSPVERQIATDSAALAPQSAGLFVTASRRSSPP